MYPSAIPFVLVHLACFAAIWTGITWQAVVDRRRRSTGCASSRSAPAIIATSRTAPMRPAAPSSSCSRSCRQSTAQKSVLWWAAKHRHHHLHSDTELDVHSPRHKGFFYSHVGWIFARRHDETDLVKIADFARYPELMWLHRYELVPSIALGVICFLDRRLVGPGGRLLLEHGAGLSRHLLHQLARPRARPQALRDRRRLAQQLAARDLHHGRGLAQQPPRLPEQRAPGLPLVGVSTRPTTSSRRCPGLGWCGTSRRRRAAVVRNEQRLGSRVINRAAAQLAGELQLGADRRARSPRRSSGPALRPAGAARRRPASRRRGAGERASAASADPRGDPRPGDRHVRADAVDRRHRRPRPRPHARRGRRPADAGDRSRRVSHRHSARQAGIWPAEAGACQKIISLQSVMVTFASQWRQERARGGRAPDERGSSWRISPLPGSAV